MIDPEELSRLELFRGLGRRHLERLASVAAERRYRRGELVFQEGDPAPGFHVVTTGRVKVYKLSPEGKEQILHVWPAGEPFGEVAVFQKRSFPANAQAMEDSTTLFIPRAGLIGLIRRDPDFALALLGVLSARLRNLADLVETISLKEVPCRLAAYLVIQESPPGLHGVVDLEVSRAELASQLGTIPETLSRAFARLTRESLVAIEGPRRIRILDPKRLREVALGLLRIA